MLSEEKEVYELIASLPIELKKINVLNDITFEAQLLMRSRFVKKINIRYEDFLNLPSISNDKEVLLTTELDNKRFIIYLENGRIISVAMSDPVKGERTVGLKPLAMLILASKSSPIQFKLFEVQPYIEEDRTRETPKSIVREIVEEKKPAEKILEKQRPSSLVEKPVIVKFAEKLVEFREKARKMISDSAPSFGCQLVDLKIGVSKGVIHVKLVVRKKGFFGKCRADELKALLDNDLNLLATMYDLNLPLKIIVSIEK
ncbi:MAG: hypothetical protein B6U89_03240 [Desulfurococcales archaeon ex4484_58]|nr:MAG: hypothetical protein B6U89_03240 [Desulfurococcales archaeon ex4484_58]